MSNGFNEYYWKSKGKEIVGNIESLDNFIKDLENNLESYEKNGGDMTDDMICKIQELFKKTKTEIVPLTLKIKERAKDDNTFFENNNNNENKIIIDLKNDREILEEQRKEKEQIYSSYQKIKEMKEQMNMDLQK